MTLQPDPFDDHTGTPATTARLAADDSTPIPFRFLSADVAGRAATISAALTAIHEPRSAVESSNVAELALARTRQYDLESAWDTMIAQARASAADRAERTARDRFVVDRDAWLADPATNLPIFAATPKGAEFLAQFWLDFAAALAPGAPGPTFDQEKLACAVLGSPWQVGSVRGEGLWLWARLLRISADPNGKLALWIGESAPPDNTWPRARWVLGQSPEDVQARAELACRAEAEHQRWARSAEALRANDRRTRAELARFPDFSFGGDAKAEKRANRLMRDLTAARNRADRLERRLDASKKAKARTERQAGTKPAGESPVPLRSESNHLSAEAAQGQGEPFGESPATAEAIEPVTIERITIETADRPFESTESIEKVENGAGLEISVACCETASASESHNTLESVDPQPVTAADHAPERCEPTVTEEDRAERRAEILRRLHRYRLLNWGDPYSVAPEDAELLVKLANLPDSPQKEAIVRLTFGSEKILRRAWRKFSAWSGQCEPCGVLADDFDG